MRRTINFIAFHNISICSNKTTVGDYKVEYNNKKLCIFFLLF